MLMVREFGLVVPWWWLCSILEVRWFVEVEEEGVLLVGKTEDVKSEREALYALQMDRLI